MWIGCVCAYVAYVVHCQHTSYITPVPMMFIFEFYFSLANEGCFSAQTKEVGDETAKSILCYQKSSGRILKQVKKYL